MKLTLNIWRQKNPQDEGRLVTYPVDDVSPDMSFLEMIVVLTEKLIAKGEEPTASAHGCREGTGGPCSMHITGRAHGPQAGTTTCQLHMRQFKDGQSITIEP